MQESRAIRLWVLSLCSLVFVMVVVGGITRLTRSGLSIVEWRPISGIIPPLSEDDWLKEFAAYQQYPEYQKINHGMDLSEFKFIYFWEYLHRLLGRLSGLVLAVPLVILGLRRRLSRPLIKKLVIALGLGGLQGFVGWYMVQSGLINEPTVSHYRLAMHLALAFFMFAFLYWTWLGLGAHSPSGRAGVGIRRLSVIITAAIAVQIIYGAFVAGMHAGYSYNTFPTMNGAWVPDGITSLKPVWLNAFENPITVQFIHRMIAWFLVAAIGTFWWRVRQSGSSASQRFAAHALLAAVALQFSLGIATIIMAVPVTLGVLHQAGAFVLLAAAVHANFVFLTPPAATLADRAKRETDTHETHTRKTLVPEKTREKKAPGVEQLCP